MTARFATPGVNIGLFCSTPMVALTRAVGRKAAMEMLLTGELIDAAARARDRAGQPGRAARPSWTTRPRSWPRQIAAKSPLTLAIGKEAFYRQAEMGLDDAYGYASEVMIRNMLAARRGRGDRRLPEQAPHRSGPAPDAWPTDPYEILGVKRDADEAAIRAAYRKLAKRLHPDLNPGKPEAAERFKQINAAYDILSDKEKRARFDRGEIDAAGNETAAPRRPGATSRDAPGREKYRAVARASTPTTWRTSSAPPFANAAGGAGSRCAGRTRSTR